MASKSSQPSSTASTPRVPPELMKLGETQAEAMLEMQKELLETYEQISRAWLERVRAEADL